MSEPEGEQAKIPAQVLEGLEFGRLARQRTCSIYPA